MLPIWRHYFEPHLVLKYHFIPVSAHETIKGFSCVLNDSESTESIADVSHLMRQSVKCSLVFGVLVRFDFSNLLASVWSSIT